MLCMAVTMARATSVKRSSTGFGTMRMVMGVRLWRYITQRSLKASLKEETEEYYG